MGRKITYFISRISKIGEITNEDIIEALKEPNFVDSRTSSYTITNFQEYIYKSEKYYFGKLTKFKKEGEIKRVDRISFKEIDALEPDLIISSSQFLYLPDYACFVFQRIWNQIDQSTFSNRMKDIILDKKEHFFADCEIKPVSDLSSFLQKIRKMQNIEELKAKVNPPNPLFGHLWKSLEEYLKSRNTSELKISEKATTQPLNSNISSFLEKIENEEDLSLIDPNDVKLGDAAVLMSIDGYGNGTIVGRTKNNQHLVIRTNQKSIQFLFPIDGNIDDLFLEAKKILDRIINQRYMSHD
jgi:hypothetical protein